MRKRKDAASLYTSPHKVAAPLPTSPHEVIDLNVWHHAIHQVTGDMALRFNRATIADLSRWARKLRTVADEMDAEQYKGCVRTVWAWAEQNRASPIIGAKDTKRRARAEQNEPGN